jgi:hypothetical protein
MVKKPEKKMHMLKGHKLAMLVSITADWIIGIKYGDLKETAVSCK